MMSKCFEVLEVESQRSAEVVHPNKPLRGRATSLTLKCPAWCGSTQRKPDSESSWPQRGCRLAGRGSPSPKRPSVTTSVEVPNPGDEPSPVERRRAGEVGFSPVDRGTCPARTRRRRGRVGRSSGPRPRRGDPARGTSRGPPARDPGEPRGPSPSSPRPPVTPGPPGPPEPRAPRRRRSAWP
jgi:hypothetical protein